MLGNFHHPISRGRQVGPTPVWKFPSIVGLYKRWRARNESYTRFLEEFDIYFKLFFKSTCEAESKHFLLLCLDFRGRADFFVNSC